MKKSVLKILAMAEVVESKLPKDIKQKHLEYIKEKADPYQCIGYILDGKFYNLNEAGKLELKRRFVKEIDETKRKEIMSHVGKSAGGLAAAGGVGYHLISGGKIMPVSFLVHIAKYYAGGFVLWATYRWIRSWFDKCSKACGTLKINDAERQMCMKKCKEQYEKKMIELTKKAYKIKKTGKKLSKEESDKIKKQIKK
jgi:hypothetical protein